MLQKPTASCLSFSKCCVISNSRTIVNNNNLFNLSPWHGIHDVMSVIGGLVWLLCSGSHYIHNEHKIDYNTYNPLQLFPSDLVTPSAAMKSLHCSTAERSPPLLLRSLLGCCGLTRAAVSTARGHRRVSSVSQFGIAAPTCQEFITR